MAKESALSCVCFHISLLQVSGYVRSADTAGKLPTKDAIVEYSFTFNGKNYRGSTLTDADGYYELNILVCFVTLMNV